METQTGGTMIESYMDALARDGARFDSGDAMDFGDAPAELAAAREGDVVVPLTQLAPIRANGEDAAAFLHSLLTSDVKALGEDRARHAGFCSPKGRLLASFLVLRESGDYLLWVARDLHAAMLRKLGMYILRSKVRLSDASGEWTAVGVAGPSSGQALAALSLAVPEGPLGISRAADACAIRLTDRLLVVCVRAARAAEAWVRLRMHARPAGVPAWRWLQIEAGIPLITTRTQEEFVPQMANFELIGGVSFQKGCYPGQEIVARTQYLGRLKRRMYLAHLGADADPAEGAPLYSPDLADQACGTVVNVAPSPVGGFDLLAVVQTTSVEGGEVRAQRPDGPRLEFRPLPYALA